MKHRNLYELIKYILRNIYNSNIKKMKKLLNTLSR